MFLHFGPFMETKGQLKIRQKFNMMVMLDASIDNLIFVSLRKKRLSEILHNVRVMTTDETNSIGPVCCWHCRFFGSPAGLGFPTYSAGAGASVLFECQSVWVFEWQGLRMPTFQCSPFGFSCAFTPSNVEGKSQ